MKNQMTAHNIMEKTSSCRNASSWIARNHRVLAATETAATVCVLYYPKLKQCENTVSIYTTGHHLGKLQL